MWDTGVVSPALQKLLDEGETHGFSGRSVIFFGNTDEHVLLIIDDHATTPAY